MPLQHPPPGRPPPAPGPARSHTEPPGPQGLLLPSALGGRPDFVVESSPARWTKVRAWRWPHRRSSRTCPGVLVTGNARTEHVSADSLLCADPLIVFSDLTLLP